MLENKSTKPASSYSGIGRDYSEYRARLTKEVLEAADILAAFVKHELRFKAASETHLGSQLIGAHRLTKAGLATCLHSIAENEAERVIEALDASGNGRYFDPNLSLEFSIEEGEALHVIDRSPGGDTVAVIPLDVERLVLVLLRAPVGHLEAFEDEEVAQ